MNIDIKKFEELSTIELYEILKLRAHVFVVEQNCVYNDLDNKDLKAFHLIIREDNKILAYLRITETNEYNGELSFGRVIVVKEGRGKGCGKILLTEVLNFIERTWKKSPITIEAQSYLQKFYESFGFKVISNEFIEDGILHKWMRKTDPS